MSHLDPYSPPQSALGGLTPDEQHARDSGALRFSGFWQRVGAALIDFLIVSPLILLDYLFGNMSPHYTLYMFLPGQLISFFLYLYLVVKYGGTPGKLALGLRIVRSDGTPVDVKAAALRYSVMWFLGLIMTVMMIIATQGFSDEQYHAFSYMERSVAVSARAPYLMIASGVMQVWLMASLICVLANKKRRALHDFMAGTVVVRK